MNKGLGPIYTKFILQSYLNQRIRTKWHHCHSDFFNISNGMKQGGVYSHIIFGMYFDELILKLKQTGIGRYIENVFTGALAYANDVVLLAPTKHTMPLLSKFTHFPWRSSKYEMLQISFFLIIEYQ